jgi:DNA modification methylase
MAETQETTGKSRHPLAVTRTELVWEGKYDGAGRRVAPLRVTLPFQTVETVNESAADRRHTLELFGQHRPTEWRNRLVWGDKKYVLPSLLAEFAGKVNLIYIDPPFATDADFSFTASVPNHPDQEDDDPASFLKKPSIIEHKAYRDTWGRGLDSYLQWFYETVVVLHELLHETGSLYVHLDWHVGHYAKAILDEVFGHNCFHTEIIWKRTSSHNDPPCYGNIHDSLFFYTKGKEYTWNIQYTDYSKEYIEAEFREDKDGKLVKYENLTGAGVTDGPSGKPWRNVDPSKSGRHWAISSRILNKYGIEDAKLTAQEKLEKLLAVGRIKTKADGTPLMRGLKTYLDELPGMPLQSIWSDLDKVGNTAKERVGYDTQKPEALLERILKSSSVEGDLVLDSFCGSGTTAAVAEKLKRRWITCDLGRFAIHTARKRLLSIPGVRPFIVQNLGKYERQLWQREEFRDKTKEEERQREYVHFILKLYQAKPLNGYSWLHGAKAGRMVQKGVS